VAPEDIKTLRRELECTARELAGALGVEQATVFAWERGELFPTKRYVDRMNALRTVGPVAIPRKVKTPAHALVSPSSSLSPSGENPSPMKALADPTLWEIVRKIIAHPTLKDQITRLAARYPDPSASSSPASSTDRVLEEPSARGTSGGSDGKGAPPADFDPESGDPSGSTAEGEA
jgi:transcriptional regulator with XRE-family HTH domain